MNKNIGSSFDSWLIEEGIFMEVHESVFHALFPEDEADKLCLQCDTLMRAEIAFTSFLLDEGMEFMDAPSGMGREEMREFILSSAKEVGNG